MSQPSPERVVPRIRMSGPERRRQLVDVGRRLDAWAPDKHSVGAHLVNLAWNGLTGLQKEPDLFIEE